jgi:excisionase family DNA binding protein
MRIEYVKQIEALRKAVVAVLPNQHNIDVAVFTERLFLRGVTVGETEQETPVVTEPGNLVHADEVAKALKVSSFTIYDMVRQGKIPCHRFGKKAVRFNMAEVYAWLDEQTKPAKVSQPRMNSMTGIVRRHLEKAVRS